MPIEAENSLAPPTMLIGIFLIVIGVAAFAYQGITYTTRDKPINLGIMEVTTKSTKTIPLSPIVGGVALVGGIVLLISTNRKTLGAR